MTETTQQDNKMAEITKKGKGNDGDQDIDQDQENKQNAQCVSGEDAIVSCNNLSFQEQINREIMH